MRERKEYFKQYSKHYYESHKRQILIQKKLYRESHKEQKKQYILNHKEEISIQSQNYRESHKEQEKQRHYQYYISHKEQRKEYNKQYYISKLQIKERHKQYYQSHREQIKQYYEDNKEKISLRYKNYRLAHKEQHNINESNRQRFIKTNIILNQSFTNSDLHHVKNGVGIYIPKVLHKSVKHCLKTNYNMNLINSKVNNWLKEQNIQVLNVY